MSTKPIENKSISISNALGPSDIKTAIQYLLKAREVPMIWGPPGIGKSDLIAEIGKETNRRVIDIRLALWEPTDIRGIPYFDRDTKEMCWATPSEFPKLAGDDAIIFLDELVSAVPTVQVGAYQLTLNRKIGTYTLPDKVDIIAAGNRENDRGVTYKMPSPLANRMTHLEMKVNFNDFQQWAIQNDIDSTVLSYLSWAKQDLFDFNPANSGKAFATPRSWHKVSNIIKSSQGASDTVLAAIIGGTVGDGMAVKYLSHRKLNDKLPKAEDIISGKLTKFKSNKDISIIYALIINCCHELRERSTEKKFATYVDNFYKFMLENFPQEYLVMGVKLSIRNYNLPIDVMELPSYDTFIEKIEKHLFVTDSN